MSLAQHIPILTPPEVDHTALRHYRLQRVRQQLIAHDIDMMILLNPVSMRYAIDLIEYNLFQSHIPTYHLFISAEGPTMLFGASHQVSHLVDIIEPTNALNVFDGGLELADRAKQFVDYINAYLKTIGAETGRIACERLLPSTYRALLDEKFTLIDAEPLMEQARLIKSDEELKCIRHSIAVAEAGMALMQENLRPGVTENQLFSLLHQVNVANDGDWIDGRMLCSGHRTNPWFQESSNKVICAGELVAFDTDMIGPNGYCADISRTFFCEPGTPTREQKAAYQLAWDELQHNMALIKPGLSFKAFSDKALRQPDEYIKNQYVCIAHGVGLTDEYPKIYYPKDWEAHGYDGIIQSNTVMSVESFVGSDKGGPGIKLEEMVYVTETGCIPLSSYPYLEEWLI